jgi:hypothetical protein
MTNHDVHEVHEALERLADVAGHDPMPNLITGIRAEARRNRNRAAALTGAGIAAALVVGYAAWSAASGPGRAGEPDVAVPSSATPTPTPTPTPSPAPDLSPIDTGTADVDDDGAPDSVRLMVPRGTPGGDPAEQTWLEVRTATTTDRVQLTDTPTYVGFLDPGLVDLDDNGGAEILVLASGGGENGLINVWTWSSGRLTRATPDPGPETHLASEAGLSTGSEELGAVFQDGQLLSWQVVTAGHEVNVWRWTLDGVTLRATRLPGTRCVSLGVLKPC